ncbi:osmotically inducible lipoprotein E [Klebsiella pneumoniae]|uniref:Osmotically inducible lipoprotein E n=1 Tax=Klebsiella pneumoniae TaxID=573 RepID=A0A2X3HH61_KLEPN|nr:osmotically inducible lipoprotein E [Klebsiella pneumoniae]
MNKSLAGILGVTVALTYCGLYRLRSYQRTSLPSRWVKDVKKGMSRQQVMQIAGKPSTESHHWSMPAAPARPISSVNEM